MHGKCVCEKERARQTERETDGEREREREIEDIFLPASPEKLTRCKLLMLSGWVDISIHAPAQRYSRC